MRDLDALLASLINIDRDRLIAILSSEAEAVARLVKSMPRRTRSQNSRRYDAIDRAARINRILQFIRQGKADPDMSEAHLSLCKSIEEKLHARSAP